MTNKQESNQNIADMLEQIADLLSVKNDNPFKINAYRDAAQTIRNSNQNIAEIAQNHPQDLEKLQDIGEGISSIITAYVHTGRSDVLERLRGEVSPVDLFSKVPGIGDTLAKRIVNKLKISSLAELEQAAYDGSLASVEGFGNTKIHNIQISLSGMLSPSAKRIRHQNEQYISTNPPDVGTLLEVDKEYRTKAAAGKLHKIAPKRFNPEGKAWLPILNTHKDGWSFTALFSNTAQAHKLGKTHDWVVIYFRKNGKESQVTVVTETRGELEGKRVVRGREDECRDYYDQKS